MSRLEPRRHGMGVQHDLGTIVGESIHNYEVRGILSPEGGSSGSNASSPDPGARLFRSLSDRVKPPGSPVDGVKRSGSERWRLKAAALRQKREDEEKAAASAEESERSNPLKSLWTNIRRKKKGRPDAANTADASNPGGRLRADFFKSKKV